jgi:putative ABC transport system permease protein
VSASLFWRMQWRLARGARARLVFFTACIAVGVAAVVGVAALVDAIDLGIRSRSRELLGGDLAIESRGPLPEVIALLPRELRTPSPRRVEMCVLSSMVHTGAGASRLAELKAIDAAASGYPLAGRLELSPARPLAQLLDDHSVLVARALAESERLQLGDDLYIGGQRFVVRGLIEREPDPLSFNFSFGPRVLMTKRALESTGLLALGHRVRYRTLLRFAGEVPSDQLAQFKRSLEAHLPGGGSFVRVETHADAQPALRRSLERVRSYLGLLALLSLLVASAGVAQIVSTWLYEIRADTAILRCLGLRPSEIAWLYLGHVLLLALAGSLLGCAVGAVLPMLIAHWHRELVPPDFGFGLRPATLARGVALGMGIAAVFSLLPLSAVWRVPPAQVLRAEATQLPAPRSLQLMAAGALLIALIASAQIEARHWPAALGFSALVVLLSLLLWAAARALIWSVERLPRRRISAFVWHAAAALARPGAGVIGSIVALGMGNLVVLSIVLIESTLTHELTSALPSGAPNLFMLDIQVDQWSAVERIARAAGARRLERVPVVMARLSAIDGRGVAALVQARAPHESDVERARWVFTREQRLTSLQHLPDDNRIVAGSLWRKPGVNELSVERDFAKDLGVQLGSHLRFDVQGVPIEFEVTSLRTVEWRSLSVNFFLVAKPGALDDAPQFLLGAARVPTGAQQRMQDQLAEEVPNVTVLRVQALIEQAVALLTQLGLAVRGLGAFAALSGVIILAGSVAASRLARAREAALLKALGLTRGQVLLLFTIEYALTGAVAGLLAVAGAYALASAFSRELLQLTEAPSWRLCAGGFLVSVGLAVVAGLLASARALQAPVLETLRE